MKWLQALLFNTNDSISHYSFICTQSNDSKYCYLISIITFLHTVKRFQVFHANSFIFKRLNGSKYCYVMPIIHCRPTVKGFQELLFNTNNSIQYSLFVCTQLNVSKNCHVSLTIQLNTNHLFAHS